ncbi:hypothetical protein DL93DRAFT_1679460 [Clavulina sp. PMI_390]|nr:hypothetical protein DL93DRAFT_1679460 [Clavulina sp. PMI_390]
MGVWADLPYELAIHVLEALSSRSSPQGDLIASSKARKDLLSCTCVSRQFHTIARPLLFRNVHLESAFPHRKQGIYQFFPAIHRFASAIILEPHLGKYVRRLFVDSLGDYYRDFDVYLSRWNQSIDEEEVQNMLSGYITGQPDLAIILDALPGLGLSNGLVMHGRSDGIFVVLLHLLPNLQVLDIESYSGIACIACSCFGGFGGRIPAALLSISELSLVPDEGPYEN